MGMWSQWRDMLSGRETQDQSRQRISDELGKDEYDQGLADSYYKDREGSINNAFHNASRNAAADMGKRGLGGSGMAVGQQQNAAFTAAAQKAAAQKSAIDQAKQVRRQGLLDEAHVWTDLTDSQNQQHQLERQDDINANNRAWQLFGLGLGGLI